MPAARKRLRAAAVLGAASSARTFAGPAGIALRGRPRSPWLRGAILALSAGELLADKLPMAGGRSETPALAGRAVAGAAAGAALRGAKGARVGTAFALAGAYAGERLRVGAVERTGLPDPAVAFAEDAVVIGGAYAAAGTDPGEPTLPVPAPPQPPPGRLATAARGLAAALVGTAAMTSVQNSIDRLTGAPSSEAPRVVGERLLGALGFAVPAQRRPTLNVATHLAYGTAWGVPYGFLARRRPGPASGLALGLGVWAVSLAELPALGLAPPPWKQPAAALVPDLGFHLVYGLASSAAFEALSA